MSEQQPTALAKLIWQDLSTGQVKEYVLLEGATATIGRSAGNDVCIPERHVSRSHAVIRYNDGIFMLSDLGSANSTFVNDRKVTDPFPLASGDIIRLFVPVLTFSAAVTAEDTENATTEGTLIAPSRTEGIAVLAVTSGAQEGAEYVLATNPVTIGRAASGLAWTISLSDRSVSRPHARLTQKSDGWYLEDLGSANGTLVNGAALTPQDEHLMRDGDVMTCGSTVLLFRIR